MKKFKIVYDLKGWGRIAQRDLSETIEAEKFSDALAKFREMQPNAVNIKVVQDDARF